MALWRIRATVDDRPGYLAVLTASLALRGVNILTVQVHTTEAGALDDFLVDAPERLTAADLVAAVERGRGRNCWVARSEARGLVDQPTRALGLASRLVRDPDSLGEALRALLGADAVTWRPAPGQSRPQAGLETMRLADPAGGSYEVLRAAPGFTPAEYARAQALVDLAANVVRRTAEQVTLVLPDGAELTVRPATAEDLPAVLAMQNRCSARTRWQRYLGAATPTPDRLRQLLEPARGMTLLAVAGGVDGTPERVVAMANLVPEGALAEVALLVEDAWQRRGLGGALMRRLVAYASRGGCAALVAHAYADNLGLLRVLHRVGRPEPVETDGDLVTVTLPLDGAQLAVAPDADVDQTTGRTAADPADASADAADEDPSGPAPVRSRAAGTA
ncbi:GNAT family N-acetyltransferase [Micromonospora sp. NPDC049523]|uniref:GNAT family N-acetyltransferase n=1 Tax=Micromonospora sp. NPDC049523 TaxID=3155921 RepID=UPI0034319847